MLEEDLLLDCVDLVFFLYSRRCCDHCDNLHDLFNLRAKASTLVQLQLIVRARCELVLECRDLTLSTKRAESLVGYYNYVKLGTKHMTASLSACSSVTKSRTTFS